MLSKIQLPHHKKLSCIQKKTNVLIVLGSILSNQS